MNKQRFEIRRTWYGRQYIYDWHCRSEVSLTHATEFMNSANGLSYLAVDMYRENMDPGRMPDVLLKELTMKKFTEYIQKNWHMVCTRFTGDRTP